MNELTWDLEKRTVRCTITSEVTQTIEDIQRDPVLGTAWRAGTMTLLE